MSKYRIIKKTYGSGLIIYAVQPEMPSLQGAHWSNEFNKNFETLEQAQHHIIALENSKKDKAVIKLEEIGVYDI